MYSLTALRQEVQNQGVGSNGFFGRPWGGMFHDLFPSYRWLPIILCIPWPVAALLQLPPPSSHSLLPCVSSVSLWSNLRLLLVRHQSVDLVLHLRIVWPHLNLITSAKTLYPNKVTFVDTRSSDWIWYLPRFLAFLNQKELIRDQARNTGKALLGPLLQQQGIRTNNRFPCLLTSWVGASLFLSRGEGRHMSRGLVEGWLRYFACPLGGGVCRGYAQFSCFCSWPSAFAPGSSKVAFGFFGLFISFVRNFALTVPCTQLFLVLYNFFVFGCLRRCVFRCKHCTSAAKGPRPQPISNVSFRGTQFNPLQHLCANWKQVFPLNGCCPSTHGLVSR